MGAVGGVASYATGGEFWQGAAMGAGGGLVAGKVLGGLGKNQAAIRGGLSKYGAGRDPGMVQDSAQWLAKQSVPTSNAARRNTMLAGAGLMGMIGGGNRNNNHRRGFNAHRGNGF
jgi:hypothetical protein